MNNLSQECINEIEKEYKDYCQKTGRRGVLISSAIKEIATHLVDHVLSTPTIYQSAGLMTVEEGIIFGMWASVYVKGIMNNWLCMMHDNTVSTLPELLTIFRQQNREK